MPKAHYEVALSGIHRRSQATKLGGLLLRRPINSRIVLGFSTGYHLLRDSELKRRPNLYVPLMEAAKLAAEVPGDYLAHFTPNLEVGTSVAEQMRMLNFWTGPWLRGVQLNVPGITPEMVRAAADVNHGRELVVPLGRRAMRHISNQDQEWLVYLLELESSGATTVLLDNSRGRKQPLTYSQLRNCVATVAQLSQLRIRVAGRLGLERLVVVERLLQDFPSLPLGWEVESRLRDELDRFDTVKARQYLAESFELIDRAS